MSAEKPDGWVACPKTNIPVLYFMGAGYSYEQMKERVIRRLRIDPKANRDEEERFVSEGWRIRPVKLQFLDEPKGEEWHNWTPDYCNHADAESAKLTYDGKLYHYGTSIGESRQVCCSCSGPNPNSARQRFLTLVSEIETEASECLVPENKKTND